MSSKHLNTRCTIICSFLFIFKLFSFTGLDLDESLVFLILFEKNNYRDKSYGTIQYANLSERKDLKNCSGSHGKPIIADLGLKQFTGANDKSSILLDEKSKNFMGKTKDVEVNGISIKLPDLPDPNSINETGVEVFGQGEARTAFVFITSSSNITSQNFSAALNQISKGNEVLVRAEEDLCILCRILMETTKMTSKV